MTRSEAKEFVLRRRKELEDLGQTPSIEMINQILTELRQKHNFICYLPCPFAGGNVGIVQIFQDENGMMIYLIQ